MFVNSDSPPGPCQLCGHEPLRKFVVPSTTVLWRCSRCGLYQYGPMAAGMPQSPPSEKPAGELSLCPEWCTEGRFRRKVRTATVRLNRIAPLLTADHVTMVDVGCGFFGAVMEAANRRGWTAMGTDVGEAAVFHCRRRGYRCEICENGHLPFEDQSFDLLTAWNVIEHVQDVTESLMEFRRVLRKGGILAMETSNANCLKARFLGARYRRFWPRGHTYTFPPRSLSQFVERAGFQVVGQPFVGRLTDLPPSMTCYALGYQAQYELRRVLRSQKAFQLFARRVDSQASQGKSRSLAATG